MPTNWNILVVEDEADTQEVVSTVLTYHGVTTHVVGDGHECLAALARIQPDAILMDLNLPELDGWATLRAIRDNPKTTHIPVLAMTAYHSANVAQDAYEVGFDAYLPKPINSDVLIDTLGDMLRS